MTLTIKLPRKKAQIILDGLEGPKLIEIVRDKVPAHWPAKKKKQAADFLKAYADAKAAERGGNELKTWDALIDEL